MDGATQLISYDSFLHFKGQRCQNACCGFMAHTSQITKFALRAFTICTGYPPSLHPPSRKNLERKQRKKNTRNLKESSRGRIPLQGRTDMQHDHFKCCVLCLSYLYFLSSFLVFLSDVYDLVAGNNSSVYIKMI